MGSSAAHLDPYRLAIAHPGEVLLTWSELTQAALVGIMRHVQDLRACRRDRFGTEKRDGWGANIEGAAGEMAVAKTLGLYWAGTGLFRGPDVGHLQVRTRRAHDFEMPVYQDDGDEARFVLVTGRAPRFRVRGWLLGREAKRAEYWGDHDGRTSCVYWVPAAALHPMETIR